ncbi:hypothetical protein [Methylobacterium oryzisoli]
MLDQTGGIVVGQPVHLRVDVLFPGSMPRPPRVRVGDAPGAQVLRFETQGVTLSADIGGQPYVGQQFEFVVFPRRQGSIDIPPAEVTLLDAAGNAAGTARGDAQRITVTAPPGIDASGPVIAADEVDATQRWEPNPEQARLKPGGALVRIVRRTAEGVPAMGMADLAFTAPEGVRIYRDPPRSEDRMNRGVVTGSRIDRVTYVFEKAGSYDLPAVVQPWWDLDGAQARMVTLAGTHVAVTQPGVAAGPRSAPARLWPYGLGTGIVVCLVLIWFGRRGRSRRWQERRAAYQASEAAARAALCRVAPGGDASLTYRALSTWLGRLPVPVRSAVRADARFAALAGDLERSLFGEGGGWSDDRGRDLRRVVKEAYRAARQAPERAPPAALPPLNPTGSAAGAAQNGLT